MINQKLSRWHLLRLSYFSIIWAIYAPIPIVMIVLGWFFVPLAAFFGAYYGIYDQLKDQKGEFPIVYHFTWPFMYPWDNDEDGIANQTYWIAPNYFLQIVYWSCVRNPVNNLRFVPYLKLDIDPTKVQFIGNLDDVEKYDTKIPQWFLCWQGIKSCIYIQWKMFGGLWRFWLGWKVYPTDVNGVTPYRKNGAGFATQFKRVAKLVKVS